MIIFRWSGSLQIYDEMYMRVIGTGADLGGGGRVHGGGGGGGRQAPPPPPPPGFLIQLVFCKKKTLWFIDVEVKYKTRWRIVNGLAANLKKNGPYI